MKYSRASIGKYKVLHKEKYVADLQEVVYRSSWERKYMQYLDRNPAVLEWGSENIIIPYYNPVEKKTRRYFVDFYAKVKDKQGKIKQYIIEVKPDCQTRPPTRKKRITNKYKNELRAYIRNQSKWKAARKWASNRGWEFIVLTEKHLDV